MNCPQIQNVDDVMSEPLPDRKIPNWYLATQLQKKGEKYLRVLTQDAKKKKKKKKNPGYKWTPLIYLGV